MLPAGTTKSNPIIIDDDSSTDSTDLAPQQFRCSPPPTYSPSPPSTIEYLHGGYFPLRGVHTVSRPSGLSFSIHTADPTLLNTISNALHENPTIMDLHLNITESPTSYLIMRLHDILYLRDWTRLSVTCPHIWRNYLYLFPHCVQLDLRFIF
uniref:Uncharacterized protein n=1 Tax=Strongyloides stercoralis TaxID=6248 RepID=A0A0K0DTU7_STRER